MTIKLADGRVLSGTPVQIVQAMRALAWMDRVSLDEYIDSVIYRTLDATGKELRVRGGRTDERAASLVAELVRLGLAELLN